MFTARTNFLLRITFLANASLVLVTTMGEDLLFDQVGPEAADPRAVGLAQALTSSWFVLGVVLFTLAAMRFQVIAGPLFAVLTTGLAFYLAVLQYGTAGLVTMLALFALLGGLSAFLLAMQRVSTLLFAAVLVGSVVFYAASQQLG